MQDLVSNVISGELQIYVNIVKRWILKDLSISKNGVQKWDFFMTDEEPFLKPGSN